MRPRRLTLLLACILLMTARPALGLDPRLVDLLTLRLGMTEPEVTLHLLAQGIAPAAVARHRLACSDAPTRSCLDSVTAPTMDGQLRVHFRTRADASSAVVDSITYTLRARAPGEHEMIHSSVLERYGTPNTSNPLTWCAQPERNGNCPQDRARLTLQPGPGVAMTLTLADPEAPP